MISDCIEVIWKCKLCWYHDKFICQPPESLHPTIHFCPSTTWGMDITGPFEAAMVSGYKYILTAADFFSKWSKQSQSEILLVRPCHSSSGPTSYSNSTFPRQSRQTRDSSSVAHPCICYMPNITSKQPLITVLCTGQRLHQGLNKTLCTILEKKKTITGRPGRISCTKPSAPTGLP